jgi:hypothetical protein
MPRRDDNPRTNCKIEVREGCEFGEYANAFRVVEDGSDCLLDFLVRCETEGKAVVVSRVRVRRGFLQDIRDRLQEDVPKLDPVLMSEETSSGLPH